jgi:DNA-binding MarR family transcriptional regulator
MSDIARRVSLQAAGLLVQSLVERGWVMRVPDPMDRQQIHLLLTDEGRHQYERVSSSMLSHLIPLIEQLAKDKIAAIETALHRVLAKEETAEDGQPDQ